MSSRFQQLLLEPAAARWAAERADADLRARITAEAESTVAPDEGDHAEFTAMDARFHASARKRHLRAFD